MSFSNNQRRFVHAKRRYERPNGLANPPNRWREPNNDDIEIKRGIKRQNGSPTKNIANDRLKRLRTKLNEEAVRAKSRWSFEKLAEELRAKQRLLAMQRKRSSTGVRRASKNWAIGASSMPDITEKFEAQQSSVAGNPDDARIQTEDNAQDKVEWDKCLGELEPVQPSGRLYIVVDTNIFIAHLSLIKDIIENKGSNEPVIYIPWMVNEELDYLKEDHANGNTRYQSQTAIKYINYALVNRTDRILGQTLDEFNEQKPGSKNPDNKILMCCTQLRDKQKNIVLLSNDFNIRNKAMIHGIRAFAHDQSASFLGNRADSRSKAEIILDNFTGLCSKVIACCAREAYGDNWYKLHLLGSKPRCTEDCIRIFKKYWFTVFREHLLKQFHKAVDHLASFLSRNDRKLKDDSSQLGDLVRHCIRVCVYLKDVRDQKNAVEETIRRLNEIKGFQ